LSFVCCECCVLLGRGLCDELSIHPEESYRLWCIVVCDLEKPREWGGHDPSWVAAPQQKKVWGQIDTYTVFVNLCSVFVSAASGLWTNFHQW